jgi:cytochrome c biogenesis protein CcdA
VVAVVVMVGVADSVNPSTVAPTMALAMQRDGARRAAAFTAGVAAVSVAAGALLVAGPGEAILSAIPHPGQRLRHVAEVGAGVVLLALAVASWLGRRRLAARLGSSSDRTDRGRGLGGAFGLGAGIMAVEMPTAFPYFGAVAAIVGTGAPLSAQLLLVLAFNVAFVAPLLGIVVLRARAGERAAARLERARDVLARRAGALLAGLLGAGGVALIVVGL